MNIKLMLNKDEEIKKLAKDPEVQIRIKASIVDEIARRAVKAVQAEAGETIDRTVRKAVTDPKTYLTRLPKDIRVEIENQAKRSVAKAIIDETSDIMEKEFYSILRRRIKSCLATIDKMDLKLILEDSVKSMLKSKFST